MNEEKKTPNRLINETSPYLLQHAYNPVDWYPWGEEAFAKARVEDKPVFLSIGYSTCHWCHVMAHESFEDEEVAALLNRDFVAIKVDKEARPDIDSVYMTVCQALTGSGGWPTSLFLTPEQKPFFAGTYFPKTARYGVMGFTDLLRAVREKWDDEREALLQAAEEILSQLRQERPAAGDTDSGLADSAVALYKQSFDEKYGGFGNAPKFPAAHNLIFLLEHYRKSGDRQALKMAELTLEKLYRGGIFDHIGYGFSRYSTDRYFLVPHFEKMLYDNALLLMAYCKAYTITEKPFYREVAEKVGAYVLREMTGPEGGFYSAQDADSEGVEGKYYVFRPEEITGLLGQETGAAFNRYYDITERGNFEGKSIPNLLKSPALSDEFAQYLPLIYEYRKKRTALHLDDKVLTSWNSLMIAALAGLYRAGGGEVYLAAAEKTQTFLEKNLCVKDTLFAAFREGTRGAAGFLDDYAFFVFGLLALYEATQKQEYLQRARHFCDKAVYNFYDGKAGGFYLYGRENERLVLQPKETYDGAIPSGNSVMAHDLLRLHRLTGDKALEGILKRQMAFLSAAAAEYPPGHSFFLTVLLEYGAGPEE